MKFLITESKLEEIIFKYLDSLDFLRIDKKKYIYFVYSEGDEYAQIKCKKNTGLCFVYYGLIDEISTLSSLEDNESKEIIGKWIENTLQMKVSLIPVPSQPTPVLLRIPYK